MGLFGVPVRMESKVKGAICPVEDGFLASVGSSLMELVAGDGIQAEVPCVGRILRKNVIQNLSIVFERSEDQPNGDHDFVLFAMVKARCL